jgi:N-acetylated-alpha-linked acidic dipeptidase
MKVPHSFRPWSITLSLTSLLMSLSPALSWGAETPLGFTQKAGRQESSVEQRFDQAINRGDLRDWMEFMSSRPHHVGTPFGKKVAEFVAGKFKEWGYDTSIETFYVLFPTPKERALTLLAPEHYDAKLTEPALAADHTSGQQNEQLPTFNFYSKDGDVTAEVVYVNYGIPSDYEQLERLGIDVKGKVVIARYGASWRGIKPKLAAEKGAIGCIIYSDPRDDGYFEGDVYPKGPYRMAEGVQRGSVMDMPLYPGDPLTPSEPATRDAKRLPMDEAPTLAKIPVLPISYEDALPILRSLSGPVAPGSWRGALPITYHVGPGPAKVRLKVQADWNLVPIHDVIARLPGSEYPDQWVIRGNHHDAWVNGADDPISGLVCLMEEARSISELVKTGWRPKRTIVFAAWDGEEPGLIGSTEWVEAHVPELADKAVAYINTDGNGRGFLQASGSHVLEKLINQVAGDVKDPEKGVTILARRKSRDLVLADPNKRRELLGSQTIHIGALGSGSDYTPFLQHMGISSVNLGFGGESGGGSYHSIYDSFDYYTRFGDPKFEYGEALSETAGRLVLRLADADILPWDFTGMAQTVQRYLGELTGLVDSMRTQTDLENRLIDEGDYEAYFDPTKTFVVPKEKPAVPFLNFAPLQNAVSRLLDVASDYADAYQTFVKDPSAHQGVPLEQVNRALLLTERALTRAEGLSGRAWYRHYIYAPGFYTGYGVKTLPGVREAIEQRQWDEADRQIRITADVLNTYSDKITEVTGLLQH